MLRSRSISQFLLLLCLVGFVAAAIPPRAPSKAAPVKNPAGPVKNPAAPAKNATVPVKYTFPVTIEHCNVPYALDRIPTNLPPTYEYSPAVCFRLNNLSAEHYVFKFWLVETKTPLEDRPFCAVPTLPKPNGPWCEKTITVDNTGANFNSSRTIWVTDTTEILAFPDFRIITRVYDGSWKQAGWMTQIVNGTVRRPPTLKKLPGVQVVEVNKTITFQASVRWVKPGDAYTRFPVVYSILNAPAGSRFVNGTFTWTPKTVGRVENIIITASVGEAGNPLSPLLFDSQKISINVLRRKGIPTPEPVVNKLPEAKLVGVIRTDPCRWLVRVHLRNFDAGAKLNATSTGMLTSCNGERRSYNWRSPRLLRIGKEGTLFVQLIHNDYGKYVYYFSDERNRTAILPVNYNQDTYRFGV